MQDKEPAKSLTDRAFLCSGRAMRQRSDRLAIEPAGAAPCARTHEIEQTDGAFCRPACRAERQACLRTCDTLSHHIAPAGSCVTGSKGAYVCADDNSHPASADMTQLWNADTPIEWKREICNMLYGASQPMWYWS